MKSAADAAGHRLAHALRRRHPGRDAGHRVLPALRLRPQALWQTMTLDTCYARPDQRAVRQRRFAEAKRLSAKPNVRRNERRRRPSPDWFTRRARRKSTPGFSEISVPSPHIPCPSTAPFLPVSPRRPIGPRTSLRREPQCRPQTPGRLSPRRRRPPVHRSGHARRPRRFLPAQQQQWAVPRSGRRRQRRGTPRPAPDRYLVRPGTWLRPVSGVRHAVTRLLSTTDAAQITSVSLTASS